MKSLLVILFFSLLRTQVFAVVRGDSKEERAAACDKSTSNQGSYRGCLEFAQQPEVTAAKISACSDETTLQAPFLNCLKYSMSSKVIPRVIHECGKVGNSAQSFYDCLNFYYSGP